MRGSVSRSLEYLRDHGYTVDVVERRLPFKKGRPTTKDLFGFIDIVALKEVKGSTLAVQSTSGGNMATRVKKIMASPHYATVKSAGWRIEVHGWRKIIAQDARGARRKLWRVRIQEV